MAHKTLKYFSCYTKHFLKLQKRIQGILKRKRREFSLFVKNVF
ncbi:hypothetical protein DU19_0744 [Chlamydia muridarum]|nr:hypothetical protein DU17_0746 [Chlamydia muridarum]KDU81694.1 hypothetical protein DU18_0744 [Chlamydia muridarum]KDU82478.1 hypothetical protein DU19_0744 [Chlamydia muridarum]KDU84522.1 hypothetical protein DU21_0746 [Chlamydia muridarum]